MSLTIEQRKKITKAFPRGRASEISRSLGLCRNAVGVYLRGQSNSLKVECAVIDEYKKLLEYRKEIEQMFE